jgi:hypothetical protein
LNEDTDYDGLKDGAEIDIDTDPILYDSDSDGVKDGSDDHPKIHDWKLQDSDQDGWSDYREIYISNTNRFDSDSDGDGIIDSKDDNPTGIL